jgi:threonine dehydrogenase-like Zn-dependent dehydrogenase
VFSCSKSEQKQLNTWVSFQSAEQPLLGQFSVSGNMPGTLSDEKVLFLSDILPTAFQAVTNTGIQNGSSIAIYGAGPVGLLSAACARMLGAEQIYMVDHHPYRLAYAQKTW